MTKGAKFAIMDAIPYMEDMIVKHIAKTLLALLLCSCTLLAACDGGNQPAETTPDEPTETEIVS